MCISHTSRLCARVFGVLLKRRLSLAPSYRCASGNGGRFRPAWRHHDLRGRNDR